MSASLTEQVAYRFCVRPAISKLARTIEATPMVDDKTNFRVDTDDVVTVKDTKGVSKKFTVEHVDERSKRHRVSRRLVLLPIDY